jgi:signal transduction histidine kinase/ActR/RegA family two-component response regulator
MTEPPRDVHFASDRVAALLEVLELMASGDTEKRLPLSNEGDELDAIAHGINVLVGELAYSSARILESQEAQAIRLREAVAQAERANAAKDVFLRNVSHEIRTPIAAILGFANLLASTDLSPEDRADLVRRLQANGQAILSLLGDLLEIARIDANKIALTPERVSVPEVVREVLTSLEIETQAKGLQVRVEIAGDAFATLRTDRYRLRQILVNLVANAVKFTESGSIVVSLGVARADAGDQWAIDVADTGIGIPADQQPTLFEPFEQVDSSITRTYGGTGLGLSLSRRLAERLGGSLVLLRSTPGQGSTFRLTLSALATASEADAAPVRKSAAPAARRLDGIHILLAEDNHDMQLTVRRILEKAGASVETALDGREAIEKASSCSFDVVLMDVRMPHVNGVQAMRTLREQGIEVPIVALSADPLTLPRAEARDLGFDDCLSKPFTVEALFAAIQLVHRLKTTTELERRV